jgi:hypothetical protein
MPPVLPFRRKRSKSKKFKAFILRQDGIIQRYAFNSRKSAINNPRYVTRRQRSTLLSKPPSDRSILYRELRRRPSRRPRPQRPPAKAAAEGPPAYPAGERPPVTPAPTRTARPTGRAGAKLTTWFKALGTTGSISDMRGAESPDLLSQDLEDFAAPRAWYSNQGGLLGRVRWQGEIGLEILIDRLNIALQFAGEESGDFDFRVAYPRWEYRYQIIETIGPTSRVLSEIKDSRPRRR